MAGFSHVYALFKFIPAESSFHSHAARVFTKFHSYLLTYAEATKFVTEVVTFSVE